MTSVCEVEDGFILVSSGKFKETFDSQKTVDVKSLHDSDSGLLRRNLEPETDS